MRRFSRPHIFGFVILVAALRLAPGGQGYWQQDVAYEIHVTLNDSAHTLSAHEKLTYTNHSPDTLEYIWFHLWPNAYKNNETAYAKQQLEGYRTRFYYAKEKQRGYIDSLDFSIDREPLRWEYHPEWIDVAKVFLDEPLVPGGRITIETPFFVKIPIVFSRLGHTGKHYEITQWYPKPAVYDAEGWHPFPYLDQGEFYSEFGTFDVYITLPKDYRIMATGDLVDGAAEYAWLDSLAAEGEALHALGKKAFKKKIKKMTKEWRKEKKAEKRKQKAENRKPELKTVHFHQENVHDFAWFADPNWIVRKGELWLPARPVGHKTNGARPDEGAGRADSTRKVTLWSMYLPKNAKLWKNSLEYVHDAGYWYSRFYGDYPYNHITAVDGDLSAGGGMEYPNITVISSGGSKDLLEFVIMHEVGHNWFYGILGSNERDHAWLDEGLNQYTNIRYWEKKYPERNGAVTVVDFIQNKLKIAKNLDFRWLMGYLGYQNRSVTNDDQPIDLTSAEFHRNNYSAIVYGKTAIFTRFLQHYLGEEKIDEVLQDFYETWKFRHPYPGDFKTFFDDHVDEDLSWFFDDAINGTEVIDYGVSSVTHRRVTVANLGTMKPPVELAFYDGKGSEIERKWLPGFDGERSVDVPDGTRRVIIDPDNYMPDINRANNMTGKPLKFNFVFDQPTFRYREVNLLPWLAWNAYNGTTVGLVGYSGFIPGYRYGLAVSPQWDFEHEKVVGSVTARRTFYKMLGFRRLAVSARMRNYSGRQGGKIAFQGTIRKPIVSTPSISARAAFYYHDIQSDAVNTTYYTPGIYKVTNIGVSYNHRPSPFISYSAGGGLTVGLNGDSFSLFQVTGNFRWNHHKKLTLRARTWLGGFVAGNYIPAQYQIWMGGGVDPDFENSFVFNRTDDGGESPVNVYDEQFIVDGPAIRGAAPFASSETAWGINLDHTLPWGPLGLFADIAGASDVKETLADMGLKLSVPSVELYFPLYQSWDGESPTITNLDWLMDRARFRFSIPFIITQ